MSYFFKRGSFEERKNEIVFHGKEIINTNPISGEQKRINMYGEILFDGKFYDGSISYDIELSDINKDTRFGFLLNNKNINNIETTFQIGLRNDFAGSSLEYFDGRQWNYKVIAGEQNMLQKKKLYNVSINLRGNSISLYVNKICLFTSDSYVQSSGGYGIFICNAFPSIISNIKNSISKPTIFSIMKFEKDFDDLYNEVITPSANKFGYQSLRADECYTTTEIIDDIIKEISHASIIIADITMDNSNVFYELGYAHALHKPTILLADVNKRSVLPFDISGYRTIFYTNSIGGKKEIEEKLNKYIENITNQN